MELTGPDFEFVPYLASLIERTTYRGEEGLRSYFADADAAWAVIDVRLLDVREVGEHLLSSGELYGTGRASGLEVRVPLTWLSKTRDGKITLLHSYKSPAEALKAVGLGE